MDDSVNTFGPNVPKLAINVFAVVTSLSAVGYICSYRSPSIRSRPRVIRRSISKNRSPIGLIVALNSTHSNQLIFTRLSAPHQNKPLLQKRSAENCCPKSPSSIPSSPRKVDDKNASASSSRKIEEKREGDLSVIQVSENQIGTLEPSRTDQPAARSAHITTDVNHAPNRHSDQLHETNSQTDVDSFQTPKLRDGAGPSSAVLPFSPISCKAEQRGRDEDCLPSRPEMQLDPSVQTLCVDIPSTADCNTPVTNRFPKFPWIVFWDFENVRVPQGVSIPKFVHCLRGFVSGFRQTGTLDPILQISAIGNAFLLPKDSSSQLVSSGVTIQHTPNWNKHKDFTDKAIFSELSLLPLQHPPPCGIVLLSGDVDFSYCISKLTALSYQTIVIGLENRSWQLAAAATTFVSLQDVLQDTSVPAHLDNLVQPPRKGFQARLVHGEQSQQVGKTDANCNPSQKSRNQPMRAKPRAHKTGHKPRENVFKSGGKRNRKVDQSETGKDKEEQLLEDVAENGDDAAETEQFPGTSGEKQPLNGKCGPPGKSCSEIFRDSPPGPENVSFEEEMDELEEVETKTLSREESAEDIVPDLSFVENITIEGKYVSTSARGFTRPMIRMTLLCLLFFTVVKYILTHMVVLYEKVGVSFL